MPKRKYKQSKQLKLPRKQRQQKQKNISKEFSIWKSIRQISVFLVGVLTLFSIYYAFYPKLNIYTLEPLDPFNPFKTPFIIESQSLLPIYEINYQFFLRHIEYSGNAVIGPIYTDWGRKPIDYLQAGRSFHAFIFLPFGIYGNKLISGDVDVIITYKPKFFPFEQNITQRFITTKNIRDEIEWLPTEQPSIK